MKKFIIALAFVIMLPMTVFGQSETTSGVTAQSIIDDVRKHLNETTAAFWESEDMILWADEGVKLIAHMTDGITVKEDIVLQEGVMLYTPTSSHYDIKFGKYDSGVEGSPIRYSHVKRTDYIPEDSQRDRPKMCFEIGGEVGVWPVPDEDISGTTMVAYLKGIPSGVTSTSSQIETPANYDVALKCYIIAMAYYKKQFQRSGDKWFQLFINLMPKGKVDEKK